MTSESLTARRRGDILAAAMKVFGQAGYAAATVDQIATEAGISKGSVYNYFESKKALFQSLFTEALAEDEAEWDRLIGLGISPTEKLVRLFDHSFGQMDRYLHVGKLVLEFWATAAREDADGDLMAGLNGMYERSMDRVGCVLDEGRAKGLFAFDGDARTAARLILSALDGLMLQAMVLGWPLPPELLATYRDGMLHALAKPPQTVPPLSGDDHA